MTKRASFEDFAIAANAGDELNVVFFGGSLTWGAGATDPQITSYRALVSQRLRETYPKARFHFWDAAIGGTGSQLGAFRLERDVLARKPDLVFLDFTVNDDPYSEPNSGRLASYESLFRRLIEKGVPVVQVILSSKKDALEPDAARPLDASHKRIAEAYGIPTADAVVVVRERVATAAETPNTLWDLAEDGTHPGDKGYALYAEVVWNAFSGAVGRKVVCKSPDKMFHADTYMSVNRVRLSQLGKAPQGWELGKPHRNAVAYDFVCSRWMDDMMIARATESAVPEKLQIEVQAQDILLFGESTQKSGDYEVRIDGGAPQTYKTHSTDGNLRHVQTIAQGLDPAKKHVVEILPKLQPGEELRLESICLAGAPAQVTKP